MSASSNVLHPPISLPNEGPPEVAAPPAPAVAVAAPPRRFTPLRLALLGGGLLAVGGAFVLPQLVASNAVDLSSIRLPAPVHPSRMATTAAPTSAPDTAAAPSAAQPAPSSFMDEIAGLGATVPPLGSAPVAPLASAPAAPPPVQPDPAAAVAPASPAPPAAAQPDPAETALKLVPAPTSSAEEVSLLGLVTAIAAELRTSREDNAALRDQVRALSSSFDGRLEDLERRTRFKEAQDAVAAMRAPLSLSSTVDLETSPAAPRPVLTVTAQADAWRVQGGSPRMAVLAPVGSGPIKIVRVGDTIDERLGKVERIYQDGRLWVVKAEHGSVRGGE